MADAITGQGGVAVPFTCDTTSAESVKSAFSEIKRKFPDHLGQSFTIHGVFYMYGLRDGEKLRSAVGTGVQNVVRLTARQGRGYTSRFD